MAAEALDAVESRSPIVVDGPFARNDLFCGLLAALRPDQPVSASPTQEGTATGAAALALMSPAGDPPKLEIALKAHVPVRLPDLPRYRAAWRAKATAPQT